jgi:membrane protease YdiL (CAAX protease family)
MLVWILGKITQSEAPLSRSALVWSAIAITSIIFGLGHLPATSVITELTPLVVARAIVLNGIAGMVLGWLYWQRGLESAIIAHFTADLMILIVLPAILA